MVFVMKPKLIGLNLCGEFPRQHGFLHFILLCILMVLEAIYHLIIVAQHKK